MGFEDLGLLPFSPGGAALAGLLPRVWTGSPFFVSSSEAELRACSSGGVGGVLGLRTSGTSSSTISSMELLLLSNMHSPNVALALGKQPAGGVLDELSSSDDP